MMHSPPRRCFAPFMNAADACRAAIVLLVAAYAPQPTAAGQDTTVIRVAPDQTLNEAVAGVKGAIKVILPAGVTEHDTAITRKATVVIKGQGDHVSTLRPSGALGPEEGVALIDQDEPFRGDLILSDFTYDRAFHPGISVRADWRANHPNQEPRDVHSTGAAVMRVGAEGTVKLRNLTVHHFDFGARDDKPTTGTAFLFGRPRHRVKWVRRGFQPHDYRKDRIVLENVRIDFKKGGNIRHRPGARHRSIDFGFVDRLRIDQDCVIRAHLCQNADPKHTVGDVWRDRGQAARCTGSTPWFTSGPASTACTATATTGYRAA